MLRRVNWCSRPSLSIEWPKKHQSAVRCSAARKSRMDLFVPWLLGYQAHIHLAHPTVGCSGQVLHKVSERARERQWMLLCSLSSVLILWVAVDWKFTENPITNTPTGGCAVQKFYCPANFSCKQSPSTRPLLTNICMRIASIGVCILDYI